MTVSYVVLAAHSTHQTTIFWSKSGIWWIVWGSLVGFISDKICHKVQALPSTVPHFRSTQTPIAHSWWASDTASQVFDGAELWIFFINTGTLWWGWTNWWLCICPHILFGICLTLLLETIEHTLWLYCCFVQPFYMTSLHIHWLCVFVFVLTKNKTLNKKAWSDLLWSEGMKEVRNL